jgi:anti-anti-sigma factor
MVHTIENRDNIIIFTLKNNDLTARISAKFKAEILIHAQPDIKAFVLDLSNIEVIDSAGIGALLLAHRQLSEYGLLLILVGAQPQVMTMLEISQLDDLFEYFNNVDEALKEIEANQNM